MVKLRSTLARKAPLVDLARSTALLAGSACTSSEPSRCSEGFEFIICGTDARLWAGQGRGEEAKALLAPVYKAFDEGLGTPDLEEAPTVLVAYLEP